MHIFHGLKEGKSLGSKSSLPFSQAMLMSRKRNVLSSTHIVRHFFW